MKSKTQQLLTELGVEIERFKGEDLLVRSPVDGSTIASLKAQSKEDVAKCVAQSRSAFEMWRDVPAPKRGEFIRRFGDTLRAHKESLAQLVSIESGKILEEGRGEVQEMIDICDFAVGLSRSLSGLTLPSERPLHVMQENWYPLGVIGVISAFNFPVAVWAWNAALAIVCGNSVIWKPSEKTPLTALASQALFEKTIQQSSDLAVPAALSIVVLGARGVGEALANDARIPMISATGSTRMGAEISPVLAKRFARALLELGGNNAVIVAPSAALDVALPSIVFGSVGTAGQRCTTTRRLLVHRSRHAEILEALERSYASLSPRIGNPLESSTLIGPLLERASFDAMQQALNIAKLEGGVVHGGARILTDNYPNAFYVQPAFVEMKTHSSVMMKETFAPILYVLPYDSLEDAVALNNSVAQGLSAAIFTTDLREAEYFKRYCDCGIANVNIGTSGAEIGGAFGGEKETGGGRESGSDSWKAYMRRQTSTSYFGKEAPALAQGIVFF